MIAAGKNEERCVNFEEGGERCGLIGRRGTRRCVMLATPHLEEDGP
jgi:hypothetical protein